MQVRPSGPSRLKGQQAPHGDGQVQGPAVLQLAQQMGGQLRPQQVQGRHVGGQGDDLPRVVPGDGHKVAVVHPTLLQVLGRPLLHSGGHLALDLIAGGGG